MVANTYIGLHFLWLAAKCRAILVSALIASSVLSSQNQTATGSSDAVEIGTDWERPDPVTAEFKSLEGLCPGNGLGGDIFANIRKNRVDVPKIYHDVALSTIIELPVPQVEHNRKKWADSQGREIGKSEGVAVRTIGFISKIKIQSRGTGESANCYFAQDADVDWHILLSYQTSLRQRESLITEITPRVHLSHVGWTVERLQRAMNTKGPVRISGWLMFDSEHQFQTGINRATPWEIHPITKIEIQEQGQWKDLDLM